MRRKLAIIGFSCLCGSVFASVFITEIGTFILTSVASFAVLAAAFAQKQRAAVLACASFTVGCLYFGTVYMIKIAPAKALDNGKRFEITATAKEVTALENDLSCYIFSADIKGQNVLISVYTNDISCSVGDTVSFSAKLKSTDKLLLPECESYYFSKGVFLKAVNIKNLSIANTSGGGIYNTVLAYRESIIEKLSLVFGDEGSALMRAMFFGDKSKLMPLAEYEITASGAAHLTAVSGMHLTLIIAVFSVLLELIGIGRLPRTKIILIILATLIFIMFFRFSSSVLRAGLMICIFYSGKLFFANSDCLNSIGFALIIILAANPLACKDVGLIFSCITTIGAGHLSPRLSKAVCLKLKAQKSRAVSLISLCLCCALTSIPISVLYFGTFSAVSVLTSLLTLPFFSVSIIFILLFTLTGGIFDSLLYPAHFGCEIMQKIFSALSRLPLSHFNTDSVFSIYFVVGALFSGILLYLALKKKRTVHMIIYCTFAALLLYAHCIVSLFTAQYSEITLYSDGSDGFAVIKDGDESYAVMLGGGETNISALYAEMLSKNIDRFNVLHIVYDNKNVLPYLNELSPIADRIVFGSDSFGYEGISDCFYSEKVCFDSKTSQLIINNVKINIASVSDMQSDSVYLCYGYEAEASDVYSPVLFFDKRQEYDAADDLFCDNKTILIDSKGRILIKER